MLSGRYDIWLDGKDMVVKPGDLVRLPKGVPHAFANKSGATSTSMFWVAPTHELKALFDRINNRPTPRRWSASRSETEVDFLPPPA